MIVFLSVAFVLVLFKGTRLRNRLALYNEGKTQDERAVGEVSFAHGGCGGTKFPRKKRAASERTQCAFEQEATRYALRA